MPKVSCLNATSAKPIALAFAMLASCPEVFAAGPLPQSGQFVAGSGTITSSATRVDITQSTSRGVIDWRSFAIGRGNTVNIVNGSGATLSRVTGTDASLIEGKLNATGSFYLINPQGVLIGAQGVVTTGGRFVASTLDADNATFMKGGSLTLAGSSHASVVNLGSISSSGGDVFLIGLAFVENAGHIAAPNGTAELVTGRRVLLKDSASDTQVFVQAGAHGDVVNDGSIRAAQIHLEAADGNIYALAGHHAALRATGTDTRDGHVWLVARKSDVQQNGVIVARDKNGAGGAVDTAAQTTHLADTRVSASSWTIGVTGLNAGPRNAKALAQSLSDGTSVTVDASGDINMLSTLRWNGDASLTLNAGHSVTLGPVTTIANAGAGNMTLRADSRGIDNNGSVINAGTIDWARSTGTVAALYDTNGTFRPGTIRTNRMWMPPPFSGLRTQATAYQLVNTIDELEKISSNLTGNFALGNNISGNRVFTPIGTGSKSGFTGQFDGYGHSMSLSFPAGSESGDDLLGLFASIGPSGVVRNFSIGGSFGLPSVGLSGVVAGESAGLIANVSTSAQMESDYIGYSLPAGVVGYNSGTIYRVTSDTTMYAQGSMAGFAYGNDGRIVQSSANVDFSGGTHAHVGGLVGYNGETGIIEQSYATGHGSGVTDGGLAESNAGVIRQSFAAVALPNSLPPGYTGGITSNNTGSIANDVYWDREVSTQSLGAGAGTLMPNANGLTTAQMSRASSFAPSWNFAPGGTWTFVPGVQHPVLQWQVAK